MKRSIIIVIMLNMVVLCLTGIKVRGNVQKDIFIDDVLISDSERYREVIGEIKGGVYTVKLEYQANDNYKVNCGGTGSHYPGIYAEDHWLKASETKKEFRFWANGALDAFYILIEHDNASQRVEGLSLDIKNIYIVRDYRATLFYELLKLLLVLGFMDALFFIYLKRDIVKRHAYIVIGLVSIFLVASLGTFAPTQISGHDLYFHLARIRGIAEALMAGEFPVKMQPEWFNGYGYPVSVFYGDILLYIPAILYIFSIPLEFCYKIYVLLINLGTVLISYFCFKRICKDKYIGVVCTAVYTLSVIRILNIYLRAAVGEYSAAMFLPLIALAMWQILTLDIKGMIYNKNSLLLCLGMTGIIQTHIISLEMTGIFLIIICLFNFKAIMRKETFQVLLNSALITIIVNIGFLIPFIDYSRESLQIFSKKDFYGIQTYGLSLYELLSINTTGIGQALPATSGLNGRLPVSLGLVLLLVLLLSAWAIIRSRGINKKARKEILQVWGFAGIAWWFSTYYFPWNYLADIKFIQNIVASIQFPWRFITISMVFVSMALGLTLSNLKNELEKKYMNFIITGLCVISAYQGIQNIDMIERNVESLAVYDGEEVMDMGIALEYIYTGTDIEELMVDNRVHSENVDVREASRDGNSMRLSYISEENAFLELPIFAYPYYQCKDPVTGEELVIEKGFTNSRIRIQVPANYEGEMEVAFVQPWYWRVAEIVSCVVLIAVLWKGYLIIFPNMPSHP